MCFTQRSPLAVPAREPSDAGSSPSNKSQQDMEEEDPWNLKRKQQREQMSEAVERARQRREEEEKRLSDERRAAAAEKLRQLDQRVGKKESKVCCKAWFGA